MKEVFKEKEVKNPIYVATLENGVVISVYGKYAEGSDGKKYRCVEEEIAEDVFEFIGWQSEQ